MRFISYMTTLRMGLKTCCCYYLNVHDLIVWTDAAAKSSVKTFWLETFAIPRTISFPNFSISWLLTIDVNDAVWNSKPISLSQTRLEGDGEDCHLQSDWPTVCPDCNTDLYIWSTRTVPEGRGYCMYEQRGTVPLLTQLAVLHWSYMMTTNKSSSSVIICSVILSQGDLMNEYFFDVFKHIPGLPRPRCCVLYFPTNADTVSQPLNAWENDNAFDPGPNDLTISWIGIHRKSSPFPNVVHNLSIFKWSSKTTTLIKTSVSKLTLLFDLSRTIPALTGRARIFSFCIFIFYPRNCIWWSPFLYFVHFTQQYG